MLGERPGFDSMNTRKNPWFRTSLQLREIDGVVASQQDRCKNRIGEFAGNSRLIEPDPEFLREPLELCAQVGDLLAQLRLAGAQGDDFSK